MKPSCAVTKLTEVYGDRPSSAYRSLEPASREAMSRIEPWPRQKSRSVSRKRSFHSTHGGGNEPTW